MQQAYWILHQPQLAFKELRYTTQFAHLFLFPILNSFSLNIMMNTKKLLKMAKKWQQRAALRRKRISFHRSTDTTSSSTAAEKGCFVVYTSDRIRFAFPISYLSNSVIQELLKISEEQFGIPTEGPITLPFDSVFLEYLIRLVQRRMDGDTEKALITSISSTRCSLPCSFQLQEHSSTRLVF